MSCPILRSAAFQPTTRACRAVALKVSTYSQLEYIVAAMLTRHVKAGGARVVQLGGSTRDLFYYPAGTVQVGGTRATQELTACMRALGSSSTSYRLLCTHQVSSSTAADMGTY